MVSFNVALLAPFCSLLGHHLRCFLIIAVWAAWDEVMSYCWGRWHLTPEGRCH